MARPASAKGVLAGSLPVDQGKNTEKRQADCLIGDARSGDSQEEEIVGESAENFHLLWLFVSRIRRRRCFGDDAWHVRSLRKRETGVLLEPVPVTGGLGQSCQIRSSRR